MYNVTIFGINLVLDPVAFTIPIGEGWNVYWYGIIIATGFLLAVIYGFSMAKKIGINEDKLLNGAIITTPICILCARTYYVIFDGEKCSSISDFFGLDGQGGFSGLAIYGAVIGAAVCAVIFSKLYKFNLLNLLDLIAASFLIGQSIGRWGNFVNQEAFGSATGSSWFGMTSEAVEYELGAGALAHPCFLYESIWCAVGFFILHRVLIHRKYYGQVALWYGAWYGAGRTIIEGFRTDSLMLGSFRVSMLLSALVAISCIVILVVINNKQKAKVKEEQYESMFSNVTDKVEDNND